MTAIVDFIYLGEANLFQEQLEGFLALAEELELKGLDGSTEEQNSEYPTESSTRCGGGTDLNQKQNITGGSMENVKSEEANVKSEGTNVKSEGTGIKIEPKLRNTSFSVQHPRMGSLIEPDTMAKIETMIEKGVHGHSCNNCGYTTKQINHMREHVEKHIDGLEYPCNSCNNKVFKSSHSLRTHRSKCLLIKN